MNFRYFLKLFKHRGGDGYVCLPLYANGVDSISE